MQVDQDVFTVASEIHAENFKIQPGDAERIARATELVEKNVNLNELLAQLAT
jgi:BioD-like phosphotransacetylase family protein